MSAREAVNRVLQVVRPVIPCRQSHVPSHGFEHGNLCILFYHMCECLQDGRNRGGRLQYVQHNRR